MAEWLGRASHGHEMYCHDLEVMGSNPGRDELDVLAEWLWWASQWHEMYCYDLEVMGLNAG